MMNMDSPKESLHSHRTKETVEFRISNFSFGNIIGNDFGGRFFLKMEPFETSESSENSHFYAKSKVSFSICEP